MIRRMRRVLWSPHVAVLAAGLMGALVWPGLARAQDTPAITPGTRMFRATMILQANLRQQNAIARQQAVVAPAYHQPAPSPAAQYQEAVNQMAGTRIVISTPPSTPLQVQQGVQYAQIRGPGGDIRRVPLARGQDTIQPRSIVVRAGESVTLKIVAQAPPKR